PTPAPAPAPTPEPAPSPAPVPVPAPAPPNTPSGSPDGGPFSGDVTFYAPGLGACGRYNAATDYIAAVSESLFDSVGAAHGIYNPNANPLCGRRIRVTLDSSVGATVDVTIVDRCTACAQNDVDLSPSAFGQLAGASLGRVRGSWFFLD
ncbi:DPBB_1 domain-containing protein, partial [Sporothrix stenoceras]